MAELDKVLEQPAEIEGRIKELNNKVKQTSEERDELKRLNDEKDGKMNEVSKERDFYSSFADSISQYPAAKDHKDEIKAKVMAGYTVEDATVSVLNKAGKLTTAAPVIEKSQVGGGSATTTVTSGGVKPVNEMTREERKQAVMDAEARGDIGIQ